MNPYRDYQAPVADEAVTKPRSDILPAVLIALALLAVQVAIYGARLGLAITGADVLITAVGVAWIGYVRSDRYLARRQLKIDREVDKLLHGVP